MSKITALQEKIARLKPTQHNCNINNPKYDICIDALTVKLLSAELIGRQEERQEILSILIKRKIDLEHNMTTCDKGISLNDENLEYHRWNKSAYMTHLQLIITLIESLSEEKP